MKGCDLLLFSWLQLFLHTQTFPHFLSFHPLLNVYQYSLMRALYVGADTAIKFYTHPQRVSNLTGFVLVK